METVGFRSHNHRTCIDEGVAAAVETAQTKGLRLTPIRRRVLEILLAEHRAMGAYEVLEVLRREGLGSQPPVAYRALSFLVEHKLAHKVERLNAFIACSHVGCGQAPVFLICKDCGTVGEITAPNVEVALTSAVQPSGFSIDTAMIEILGQCPGCHDNAP
jgi:Fur family zinc uptake transcriptional regulator